MHEQIVTGDGHHKEHPARFYVLQCCTEPDLTAHVHHSPTYFSELSHIFFDPSTPDKVSEYDRMKQDLDKSVRENRHLSRQMEQWKRQLAEETSSGKSCCTHYDLSKTSKVGQYPNFRGVPHRKHCVDHSKPNR